MGWVAPTIVLAGVTILWGMLVSMQSRLGRLEHRLNLLLRHFNLEPTAGTELSDRVKNLADDPSRKIEAIKVHREETGVGLAEAKAAVEAYMNRR